MKKHLICLSAVLLLLTVKAWSCSCIYQGPFLQMVPQTPLVAVVKVTKYLTFQDIDAVKTPMSMQVEIIEIYKGSENRKKVTVWGDPGNLCRPYLSAFKEGQYYVIAFSPGKTKGGHKDELATDYTINNCGAYWLTVDFDKKTISGDIDSKDRQSKSMSLSALKSRLDPGRNGKIN